MAKNQVTLTFAGESKSLERTFDGLSAGAKSVEADLDKVGRSADKSVRGIDRVGESADGAETRFTGLASGIDGVTTLMANPTPQEFAQGIADMADGVANSAVPALQRLRDGVGASITKLREGGPAADDLKGKLRGLGTVAVVAAGIVAVGAAIDQVNKAISDAKIEQLETQFLATGDAAATLAEIGNEGMWHPFRSGATELIGVFETLLRQSPDLAESFVEQMEAENGVTGATEQMRAAIDTARAANEGSTEAVEANVEALRTWGEAIAAQFDPILGLISAQNENAEAQRAVGEAQTALNDAIAEYGLASPEAAEAARALSDAQLANVESALGVTTATHGLTEAIRNGDLTIGQIRDQMATWDRQGLLTDGVLAAVADRMGITIDQARTLGETDPTIDVHALDFATSPILSIGERLGWLDGRRATTYVDLVRTEIIRTIQQGLGWGAATGGIVPQYLASGSGSVIGGPRGTDTIPAWLTPGEMVLNDSQQAALWAMANGAGRGRGGGNVYHVTVMGSVLSDRDLARKLRELESTGARR